MLLKELLKLKIDELEAVQKRVKKELETAPSGYIRVAYKHKCPQYYLLKDRTDRNGIYLNKNQAPLVNAILLRDYNKKLLREINRQLTILKKCYAIYAPEKFAAVYETTSTPRKLNVQPKIITNEKYAADWQNMPYTPKEIDKSVPILFTAKGEKVRSKSEVIIADTLLRMGIPYRYEAPLKLGNKVFHPDFTCLNTRLRKEFLWEHFGLLDNAEYAENTIRKLRLYHQQGYFQGENLITSEETQTTPLTSKDVEMLVGKYLV